MSKKNTRRNTVFNYAFVRAVYLPGQHACPWFQSSTDEQQSDMDDVCTTCGKTKWDHHAQYHKQHEAWRDR